MLITYFSMYLFIYSFIYQSFFLLSKHSIIKLNTWMYVNIIIIEMIHNLLHWNYAAPVLVNVITVVN